MSANPPADAFFLGRHFDLADKQMKAEPILYDPRDLTTHGVIVGMTGSGKTGLSITLLEEAALQGVPSIIVDLKGDLSNLLLNFPEMSAEQLAPWIDADEARRKGVTVEELASERAERWRAEMAEWGQDADRVRKLRDVAEWRIYTPGSEAGLPVSVIQNFAAPTGTLDRETLNQRVESTTTALLGLTQLNADPVQSREHILIANLLLNAWSAGRDLDLPHLIGEITNPPIRTIGAFDIDMFYPEDARLQLALSLNNLLASPSFSTWLDGEPLRLAGMLHDDAGRPRQLIFYLAHLDDSQRMFFLSLLLSEVLAWTRTQAGTTSLRALLYIDEIFGYLPPHPANPPTKRPLMTLLKQARAFGVGVLLATQNPVDIDYKALSNAGTWFIGKLQTERDKARLMEGLSTVGAETGTLTDTDYLERAISSLGNRVFLMHNVHAGAPVLLRTRGAMSHLYGPMTRDHVALLMRDRRGTVAAALPATRQKACADCSGVSPAVAKFCMHCGTELPIPKAEGELLVLPPPTIAPSVTPVQPVLPPGLVQFFVPEEPGLFGDEPIIGRMYQPRLLAFAEVAFSDKKHGLSVTRPYRLLAPPPDAVDPEPWPRAVQVGETISAEPEANGAVWAALPDTVNDPKKLKKLETAFAAFLAKNAVCTTLINRKLGLTSKFDESREEFVARCREAAVEIAGGDARAARQGDEVTEVRTAPKKGDIGVTHFGVAWVPAVRLEGHPDEAWLPAYRAVSLSPDCWRATGVAGNTGDSGSAEEG